MVGNCTGKKINFPFLVPLPFCSFGLRFSSGMSLACYMGVNESDVLLPYWLERTGFPDSLDFAIYLS